MDSLLPETQNESGLFMRSFDYAVASLGSRVRLGRLKFLYWDKKWHEAIYVVHNRIDSFIDKAYARIHQVKESDGSGAEHDLVDSDRYVLLDEMAKHTHDGNDLRSQIIAVFMPARESTGLALSNIFHLLARHPKVYERLREEVLPTWNDPITFEMLKSMRYVQWIINEGLWKRDVHRLCPTYHL